MEENIQLHPDQQNNETKAPKTNQGSNTSNRGFASMDGTKQREIASKGGETVSQNREHMAEIGRKGGEAVSRNREHMAQIGRKGGEASRGKNNANNNTNTNNNANTGTNTTTNTPPNNTNNTNNTGRQQ
jgi:general stress protein YciG